MSIINDSKSYWEGGSDMTEELKEKFTRVRELLKKLKLDGILMTQTPNFYWITGGKNDIVDSGSGNAASRVLLLDDKAYVFCNSSEFYRVSEEELPDDAFEKVMYYWHYNEAEVIGKYMEGKKIGSDNGDFGTENIAHEIQKMRYVLTEAERARMMEIGPECAKILEDCVREVKKGQTELEIAGFVNAAFTAKGYTIPVCLVGSDERLLKYRHPLPKDKKIENIIMVAICPQKYGLTISISRIKSFVKLSKEIKDKYDALLKIDATYIVNTKAGVLSRDILQKAYEVYKETGYEKDFHLHHQGGALGYLTRDYCTNFRTEEVVQNHQGYSWNPTISGVKIEDTYVIEGEAQNIVSYSGNWVYREVTVDGKTILRPDILIQEN